MYIATTRFDTKTHLENKIWKLKNKFEGCIYGTPHRISEKLAINRKIIVIEMNNSTNKILGIGCINNYLRLDKKCKIHKDPKYNRYIYTGKKSRKDRKDIDKNMLNDLEYLLFKTSGHNKRLRGITRINKRRLGLELDTDFMIGNKVKKIKGTHIGKIGTVVCRNNNKITVQYELDGEIKYWSQRYGLTNYVKLSDKIKVSKKKTGKYKCSLCGENKKMHNCLMLKHSKKLEDHTYKYLIRLFN